MNYALFDRIKSGESPEDIAQEFTKELNTAIAAHEEEKIKAAVETKKENEKMSYAQTIVTALQTFAHEYYPEAERLLTFTPEEFCEACASAVEMDSTLEVLDKLFKGLFK